MDILAAMFAYLVGVAGILGGLALSFVLFFSPPGQISPTPTRAVAMAARSDHAAPAPVSTVAKVRASHKPIAAAKLPNGSLVAIDARQKPLNSQARLRRLAEKQRARQLAYREHSSFETRFLHFDD